MALAPEDVLAGYAFQIEVDGVTIAQFQEVSGISSEVQVIEQRSNMPKGLPVVKKTPGAIKHGDIQLKRGHTDSTHLQDWIKTVMQGNISQARKNGSVVIYDYERGEVARYNFVNAWPSKWSLGTLKAGSNDILLEEVTIAHEGLTPA
jgi:phage tail-like protein